MNHKTFATKLAKQAGKIILENFKLNMKKEWKADGTPLTDTDNKINDFVVNSIKKEFPEHGIWAEEGGDKNKHADYLWLCDPVDGTIPFSHGIPTCVFSIALVFKGEPILGVVLDPFQNRLYYAEKNKGAFLNDKPIHVSNAKELSNSVVCTISWLKARHGLADLTEKLIKSNTLVVNPGSTVYAGMLVASGELAATIWPGHTPWDVAPVKIIVEEAGGKVTDIGGHEQPYNQDIKGGLATNDHLHQTLVEIIQKKIK